MNCNNCNSDNTQRLEVVYENGTQNINTKSRSTGLGFSRFGSSIGFGRTKTTGVARSTAAIKAAPPAKKKLLWFIVMVIVGISFVGSKNNVSHDYIIGVILLAVGGFFLYKNITFNKKTYPQLYQSWLKSWMCNKCGSIFHTESN